MGAELATIKEARMAFRARPISLLAAELACVVLTLWSVVLAGLVVQLVVPAGAQAAREIPVGLASSADQTLRDRQWLYAIRFVLDRDTTMYRWFSQMKSKGASWDEHPGPKCSAPGEGCHGGGDGGDINVRLVPVKADGTPDLSRVLAQETVDSRTRYFETKSAYKVSLISLFWYFNMGGVQLKANTPYAMVYRNVHPDPANNWSSTNSVAVKESEAGPNARNTLDPNAPGAIAGLDPREATAWSTNGGQTWTWGRQVGHYYGSTTGDTGTRLPHYAWQSSPTAKPQANQPYTAYMTTCTACTLVNRAVPRRTVLTEAGGYAPVGQSVGVVTVRNTRTGQTGRTAALGSGIRRGPLDRPVTVEVGDTYEVTNSGTVFKMEADAYLVEILGLGSGAFPFTTNGHGADHTQVFALPHPYYAAVLTPPASSGDLALGKPATASSSESSLYVPAKAVDGSSSTRWSSTFTNNQWWQVDLGSVQQISRVELNWEAAYASQYKIQTSTDGTTFTDAAVVSITSPGLKTTSFPARSTRYVRVLGVTRATQWGISLWDARVFR